MHPWLLALSHVSACHLVLRLRRRIQSRLQRSATSTTPLPMNWYLFQAFLCPILTSPLWRPIISRYQCALRLSVRF